MTAQGVDAVQLQELVSAKVLAAAPLNDVQLDEALLWSGRLRPRTPNTPGGSLPMTCVAHPHTQGFEKAPSGWRANFSIPTPSSWAPVVSDPFQLSFSW
jgi:hypothetical protein